MLAILLLVNLLNFVLIFVGVLTVTEYRPEDVETLEVRGGSGQTGGNPNTSADNEASSEDNNGTNEIHQGDSLTVLVRLPLPCHRYTNPYADMEYRLRSLR